jgi:hypothetical protein
MGREGYNFTVILLQRTLHNNGMRPTADTRAVIFTYLLGRRVMPGVRCAQRPAL